MPSTRSCRPGAINTHDYPTFPFPDQTPQQGQAFDRPYDQLLLDHPELQDLSLQPYNNFALMAPGIPPTSKHPWGGPVVSDRKGCPAIAQCTPDMRHLLASVPSKAYTTHPDDSMARKHPRSRVEAGATLALGMPALKRQASDEAKHAVDQNKDTGAVDQEISEHQLVQTQEAPIRRNRGPRTPHKLVERRYRETLNGQFDALKSKLPQLVDGERSLATPPSDEDLDEDGAVRPPLYKNPSKGTIMTTAAGYIDELVAEKALLHDQVDRLTDQVNGLQKLVQCDDCAVMKYFSDLQAR